WAEIERQVVSRETRQPTVDLGGIPVEAPAGMGDPIDDMGEPEDIVEGLPVFEVLHDSDVLVLPSTCDSVEEALTCGGSVTIVRKWTKAKIEQMAAAGAIRGDAADDLKESMGKVEQSPRDIEKTLNE